MRDPNRIYPFLNKLAELWMLKPDYRFWQLLSSIPLSGDPFFLEESDTELIFDKEIQRVQQWRSEHASQAHQAVKSKEE